MGNNNGSPTLKLSIQPGGSIDDQITLNTLVAIYNEQHAAIDAEAGSEIRGNTVTLSTNTGDGTNDGLTQGSGNNVTVGVRLQGKSVDQAIGAFEHELNHVLNLNGLSINDGPAAESLGIEGANHLVAPDGQTPFEFKVLQSLVDTNEGGGFDSQLQKYQYFYDSQYLNSPNKAAIDKYLADNGLTIANPADFSPGYNNVDGSIPPDPSLDPQGFNNWVDNNAANGGPNYDVASSGNGNGDNYGGAYGYAGDQAFSGGSYGGDTYGGAYGYAGDQAFSGGSYGDNSYSGDTYGGAYGYAGDQAFSGGSYGDSSYGGDTYGGGSYGGAYGYGGDQAFSGGSYGGGGSGSPIILDLSGKGINIQELSTSNMFFDMAGSGLQHRTAWAGAGSAVLFYDPSNTGAITQQNQVVLTQWDPTAKNDMQALRDVFDSNGDGVFNASDAKWSLFKVMVTNADGTTTAETLAQAGITSINLKTDTTDIKYADGSEITGETTFTKSNGATGTVAAVSFSYDAAGHAIATTTSTDGSGTVTLTNTGTNPDGSIAFVETSVTNATGTSETITYDNNGDGVIDRKQTITKTTDGSGNVTELRTDYNGGGIKLSAVQTVTSADNKTITISRDLTGGGWYDQRETRVTAADSSRTVTITNLNQDGSEISQTSTAYSVNGLTNTVSTDLNSDGVADRVTTDALVNNSDGSRSETVTVKSANGTVLSTKWITTSADGKTTTASIDENGDGLVDLKTASIITMNADGTSTSTIKNYSQNGIYINGNTVVTSADGLSTTTSEDISGNGFADRTISDDKTVASDGSRTELQEISNRNGALMWSRWTTLAADQITKVDLIDSDNNGSNDTAEYVSLTGSNADFMPNTMADGKFTYDLNGNVLTGSTSYASLDGLTTDTYISHTGNMQIAETVIHDAKVKNSNGTSAETVDLHSSSNALIEETITTTSADGLTATTTTDINGDGVVDYSHKSVRAVAGDLSTTVTVSDYNGNGTLRDQSITSATADRRTINITVDANGDGHIDQTESILTATNGTVTDTLINKAINGSTIDQSQTITTANGLSRTRNSDIDGNGTWDKINTDVSVYNVDGSTTETIDNRSNNNSLLNRQTITVSGNGLTRTVATDFNGDTLADNTALSQTTLNVDGSRQTLLRHTSQNGTVVSNQWTTVSGNGLSTTITHDYNGDSTLDQSSTDVTVYNADGSITETQTGYTGTTTGTVREVTTTTSNILPVGGGKETITTHQSNGSVSYYSVDTNVEVASGEVDDRIQTYSAQGGALLRQTMQAVSGNGLTVTNFVDVNGDNTWDFWTTSAETFSDDGSTTQTVTLNNAAGIVSETVTNVSGNGLATTTSYDQNGAQSAGNPVFNKVVTDAVVINQDGSHVETVTSKNANGTATSQSVSTTSADRLTVTTNRQLGETSTFSHIDQTDVMQTGLDGTLTETIATWGATAALLSTIVTTASASGLASTKTYKNGSGTVVDTQGNTTTLTVDGSASTLFTDSDVVTTGTTLGTSRTTLISGNGLSTTVTLGLTGALATGMATSYNTVATDAITYATTGIATTTIADTVNGTASDTETITTSANGLTRTTSLKQQGAASAFYADQFVTNLDGSTTETTTFYNPSALATILDQSVTNVSWDGRTTVTNTITDYDAATNQVITINHAVDSNSATTVTPTFATTYNTITDTFTRNVDGTTKDQRSGTGAFGTGGYSQTTTWTPNINASQTVATANYDSSGFVLGRTTHTTTPNDLSIGMAMDYTGLETAQNLATAAANLAAGMAVSGLLASDTIASQIIMLNADGTKTTTTQYQLANSGSPILLEKSIATVSANGLVTTTQVDNDGNGVSERTEVRTVNPDGSVTDVNTYYGNTAATATTVAGANTYTTSANGLITTLVTSTGEMDTTVHFANGNGSYQWSSVVTTGSVAASNGNKASWATHSIDANGMDSWTDFDGATNTTTSVVIAKGLEDQYLATANLIAQTILGHSLDNGQREYVSHFITNGVLDREQLAYWLVTSKEYQNNSLLKNFAGTLMTAKFYTIPFFENALGRLPNSEELAAADSYLPNASASNLPISYSGLAQSAVAVAEYASEYELVSNKVLADSNVSLLLSNSTLNPTAPAWLNNASSTLWATGTAYSVNNTYIAAHQSIGGVSNITITGNGNIMLIVGGLGTATLNGINNTIEVYAGGIINTSYSEVLIDTTSTTVNGNYNQIVVGAGGALTDVGSFNTVSAATGTTINLGANSTDTINGAGLTINLSNGDNITATNNTINVAANAAVTVTGTGDIIRLATGDAVNTNANTVNVASGAAVTINGTSNIVNASNATVNLYSGSNSLVGSGDAIYDTSGGSGHSVSISAGSTDTAYSNGMVLLASANDNLTLNGTSETVQYAAVTGNETLSGFSSTDIIQFSHLSFANWTALQGAMTQVGANTVITLDATDKVTLSGITKSTLVASEFRFA